MPRREIIEAATICQRLWKDPDKGVCVWEREWEREEEEGNVCVLVFFVYVTLGLWLCDAFGCVFVKIFLGICAFVYLFSTCVYIARVSWMPLRLYTSVIRECISMSACLHTYVFLCTYEIISTDVYLFASTCMNVLVRARDKEWVSESQKWPKKVKTVAICQLLFHCSHWFWSICEKVLAKQNIYTFAIFIFY